MSESLLELAVRKYGSPEAFLAELTPEQRERIPYEWRAWGRPEQLEPEGDWRVWFCLAGRGWGKSRTGAEWVRAQVKAGLAGRIALVARTASDVRDVIVEGESGILAISPKDERPIWEPSRRRLTWPHNGRDERATINDGEVVKPALA